jgi:CRISPR-associated protein Csb2
VLPLANIMHGHADGRIMGFALIMPASAAQEQWMAMSAMLFGIEGKLSLTEVQLGADAARVVQVERPVKGLSPDRYVGTSTIWSTVTPILLSRRPDNGRDPKPPNLLEGRVRDQVVKDCVKAGLPAPVRVQVSSVSPFDGVGPARSFHQSRGGPARWATHATLIFDRPVHGPVLVGAGRYNGLGLLVPHPDEEA